MEGNFTGITADNFNYFLGHVTAAGFPITEARWEESRSFAIALTEGKKVTP